VVRQPLRPGLRHRPRHRRDLLQPVLRRRDKPPQDRRSGLFHVHRDRDRLVPFLLDAAADGRDDSDRVRDGNSHADGEPYEVSDSRFRDVFWAVADHLGGEQLPEMHSARGGVQCHGFGAERVDGEREQDFVVVVLDFDFVERASGCERAGYWVVGRSRDGGRDGGCCFALGSCIAHFQWLYTAKNGRTYALRHGGGQDKMET